MSRPDSRYCDNCGASVSFYSAEYVTHEERTDFDRNVALLFNLTGIGAIIIGIVGGIGILSMSDDFPGVGAFAVLIVVGGLAGGGVFLYLANRIKEKR